MVNNRISYDAHIPTYFWLHFTKKQTFQQTLYLLTDRSLPVVAAASGESA